MESSGAVRGSNRGLGLAELHPGLGRGVLKGVYRPLEELRAGARSNYLHESTLACPSMMSQPMDN